MKEHIIRIISYVNELNQMYDSQFVLYFDSMNWELFDLRVCKYILRDSYKHSQSFAEQLQRLVFDFSRVQFLKAVRADRVNKQDSWSIKRMIKLYGPDSYFFTPKILSIYYGFNKER